MGKSLLCCLCCKKRKKGERQNLIGKEDLISENAELQQEVTDLKKQAEVKDSEIAKLKEKLNKLQIEFNKTKKTLGEKSQKLEETLHKNAKNKDKIGKLKDEISEMENKLQEKSQKLQEALHKLSAEMSTKVSADESSVENVSVLNRPMNVAEEYQFACSNQWLEAKTELDEVEGYLDIDKIAVLHHVIQCSDEEATKLYSEVSSNVEAFVNMLQTFGHLTDDDKQHEKVLQARYEKQGDNASLPYIQLKKGIPADLQNAIGDFLRNHSTETSLDKMKMAVINKLDDIYNKRDAASVKQLWQNTKDTQEMNNYVACMVRIAWKMAIQRPPMEFKYSDKWEGETKQELYWSSSRTDNAAAVEIYPMLFHGDSLMAKGKIYLYEQSSL